jgi:Zn-dependent M16 (insulinase) family peptidase
MSMEVNQQFQQASTADFCGRNLQTTCYRVGIVEGARELLARLRREAAVGFYSTYYHPNNTVLAVVGDIPDREVKSKLIPGLGVRSQRSFST